MTDPTITRSRLTGAIYLLYFLTAIVGDVFASRAGAGGLNTVPENAPTTILAHETSFRLGFAFDLLSIACYVVVTVLLYRLLRPVGRTRARLAVCFSLIGLAVQAVAEFGQLAPLVLLSGDRYLDGFTTGQLHALALVFLTVRHQLDGVGLVFDGLFLILLGGLIISSTFLPRALGILVTLAGVGWLTFLAPSLTTPALPYVEILGFAAEAALMLWLLIVGVSHRRA